jgi:hypothetical protein
MPAWVLQKVGEFFPYRMKKNARAIFFVELQYGEISHKNHF